MMLINLYGEHHDKQEVVCAPGLPHPGDHGGYSPHGDDEGFSYQGRAGPVAVPCSLLRRSLDAAASLQAAFQDR